MYDLDLFTRGSRIAYFSMEIALQNDIPTYSGGLGILAGDTMRSAADLELPMVAVSLVSQSGYFCQRIDEQGRQQEKSCHWDPASVARPLAAKVAVPIESRTVWVAGWLYILKGHMNGQQPVILLDTDIDENLAEDRLITHRLYGGDEIYRLNPHFRFDAEKFGSKYEQLFREVKDEVISAVKIITEPDSADIYIDGVHRGISPLTINPIYATKHMFTAVKEEYELKAM